MTHENRVGLELDKVVPFQYWKKLRGRIVTGGEGGGWVQLYNKHEGRTFELTDRDIKEKIMEPTQKRTTETFKISGNWSAQSKQLKEKYPQLTDSDLKFEPGKEEELLTRLQSRLHKNRQEVIAVIGHTQLERV